MKVCGKIIITLLCSVLFLTAHAQSAHWSVKAYDYRYDMTVYYMLEITGLQVSSLENYEVAAFVGDECRGVGNVLSHDGSFYGYLRIRSNQEEGETVTFKVYNRWTESEMMIEGVSIPFKSQDVVGLPSNPLKLIIPILPGDVNGDGIINVVDLTWLIDKILGKENRFFIDAAGDLNGDGIHNSVDLYLLLNMIVG